MISDDDVNDIINGSAKNDDLGMLKQHVQDLMGKFDAVHIFATRHTPDEGGTVNCQFGNGNWFARYGQIKEWTIYEEQCIGNKLKEGE